MLSHVGSHGGGTVHVLPHVGVTYHSASAVTLGGRVGLVRETYHSALAVTLRGHVGLV